MKNLTFTLALFVLIIFSANAQWQQTTAPSDDPAGVYTLAHHDNSIYAGIGNRGVYITTDQGQTWAAKNEGLSNYLITNFAFIDPYIFVSTMMGVFRTTVNQSGWTYVSNGLADTEVHALTVKGTNLYAGSGGNMQAGVYMSSNNGDNWSKISNGLSAPAIRALTNNGQNFFLGIYGSGNGSGIFLSTNDGSDWIESNNGITNKKIWRLQILDDKVYAGIENSGVFFSSDQGLNWLPRNDGLTDSIIRDFEVKGSNIFVGTNDGGAFLSTNGGQIWESINTGLANLTVSSLTVDGSYIYAGTADGGVGQNGVWRRPLSEIIPSSNSIQITSPNGGEDWLIGTTEQIEWTSSGVSNLKIEYSTNNGLSWITIENLYPAASGSYGWDIPSNPTTQCLVKLSDANDLNVYDISDGTFSLVTPTPFWQFSGFGGESVAVIEGDLIGKTYAGSYQTGLYRSTDNGGSWNFVNTGGTGGVKVIKVNPAGEIFVAYGNEDKLRYSTNDGGSWQLSNTFSNGINEIESRSSGFVMAGHGGGLERSSNYGNTWEHISFSFGGPCLSLAYDQSNRLYFGTFDEFNNQIILYRSTNDGDNWTSLGQIPSFSGRSRAFAFIDNFIFVGTDDSGVFRSSNDGVSWTKINNGLTVLNVHDFIVDGDKNLYVGINGGIFKSGDYGTSWENVSWGLNSTQVVDLGKDSDGYLYAGIWSSGGLYRSIQPSGSSSLLLLTPNGGEEWVAGTQHQITWSSTNIDNIRLEYSLDNEVSWIQITSSIPAGSGTYNWTVPSTISGCKIKITDISNVLLYDVSDAEFHITNPLDISDDNSFPTEYRLLQNHPNPFNPSTKIKYSVPQSSNVVIKVFDVLGKEIETLVNEEKSAGNYELNWNAANLPSGIYFYRLQTESFVQTRKMILLK